MIKLFWTNKRIVRKINKTNDNLIKETLKKLKDSLLAKILEEINKTVDSFKIEGSVEEHIYKYLTETILTEYFLWGILSYRTMFYFRRFVKKEMKRLKGGTNDKKDN